MPRKSTIRKARQDAREGKAPTTQAGEFVREEMEHIRQGKHGARSTKQAIAIGLSKARREGVPLRPPKPGRTSERTRKQAERAYAKGQSGQGRKKPAAKRSRATLGALKREPRTAASRQALATQAHTTAAERRKRGTVTRTIKAAARRKRATPRALRSHRRVTSSRKAAMRRKAA